MTANLGGARRGHRFAFAVAAVVSVACSRPEARHEVGESAHQAPSSTAPPVAAARPLDASPGTPSYDRAADLAARELDAKARFDSAARTRVVGDVFLLVQRGGDAALFDHAVSLLERALPALLDGRFTTPPTRAVTVVLFPAHEPFVEVLRAHAIETKTPVDLTDLGIYRRTAREIDVDVSGGEGYLPTLTHEVVHVLVESDFPHVALWFEEGLASLYEAPTFPADGGIGGVSKNRRQARLIAALADARAAKEVSLGALFAMGEDAFEARGADRKIDGAKRSLHYAMARAFVAWLEERGWLWGFYRAWKGGGQRDVSGERALGEVTGMGVSEASGEWVRWVRGRARE